MQSDVRMMNNDREIFEWIDKGHLASTAADRQNMTLVWHKLVSPHIHWLIIFHLKLLLDWCSCRCCATRQQRSGPLVALPTHTCFALSRTDVGEYARTPNQATLSAVYHVDVR